MRVFVTGASGFIGAHIIRALLLRNHQVTVLSIPDDPMTSLQPMYTQIDTIAGTLEDAALLEKSINRFQPEACIHLAWYAEPGKYLDSMQNIQSLASSLSLFQTLIKAGCRQIVAAGTCFEYDMNFGYLHEDTPARPTSLYAAAKLSCCLLGSQLATQAKISFAWGRVFYPYGPQEDQRRLVPAAIKALKQGIPFPASPGDQVRDYIHVADVATAFCTLMEKQADGVFNISTGSPVSIRQLLEMLGKLMNRSDLIKLGALPYRNWEPPFICGDNARLRNLGWRYCFSLEEGLLETIQQCNCSIDLSSKSSFVPLED
ncbi:MAG: NAD(P)-dependent oxidoreductase [Proteobacteria bacterium]|nr:NAD(P)-dependent oxidoreductase [Pseudomonadota bacterium]